MTARTVQNAGFFWRGGGRGVGTCGVDDNTLQGQKSVHTAVMKSKPFIYVLENLWKSQWSNIFIFTITWISNVRQNAPISHDLDMINYDRCPESCPRWCKSIHQCFGKPLEEHFKVNIFTFKIINILFPITCVAKFSKTMRYSQEFTGLNSTNHLAGIKTCYKNEYKLMQL